MEMEAREDQQMPITVPSALSVPIGAWYLPHRQSRAEKMSSIEGVYTTVDCYAQHTSYLPRINAPPIHGTDLFRHASYVTELTSYGKQPARGKIAVVAGINVFMISAYTDDVCI